jgi:O-antigen/teichoic acid export membrane protein
MLPAVLVTWINRQADRIVLLTILGLSGVGIFGVASQISSMVQLPASIFNKAWTPYAMSLLGDTKVEERNLFYRRMLNYYAAFFTSFGLALTAISFELFRFLIDTEFRQGYVIIPWIVGAAILHGSGNIINLGVLISEKTYANSLAAWSGALLNIGIAIILIPLFGFSGAAIGAFIAEITFVGILWYYTAHKSTIRFDRRAIMISLFTYIVSSIVMISLSSAVSNLWLSLSLRLLILGGSVLLVLSQTIDRGARRAIRSIITQLPKIIQTRVSA